MSINRWPLLAGLIPAIMGTSLTMTEGLSSNDSLPLPERVKLSSVKDEAMPLPQGTIAFSQTSNIAIRVYTVDGQPRINLHNKETGVTELQGASVTVESTAGGVIYRYAGELTVEVEIADSGAQTISLNGVPLTEYATVTGTVFYLPRIALPPNAVIAIELVDVSRADAPAIILASQQIASQGRQVPFPFQLIYDPKQIDSRLVYAVQARITVDGALRFITTSQVPVITSGNPSEVEVRVDLTDETAIDDTAMLPNAVWQLQQIQYGDGTRLEASQPSDYTIEFRDDGQLSIRADCNQVLGNFTEANNRLSIALGPTTLAACGPDSIDQAYLQALQNTAAYFFQAGSLFIDLADDAGTMEFTTAPTTPE